MAFLETQKLAVKKRAHFQCCLCHTLGVEIHHIIPVASGGPDSEDNAAPLCPSCHDTYGANSEKRKFIREVRDFWYELCEKKTAIHTEELKVISDKLEQVATKDDVARLSVQNTSFVLGHPTAVIAPWEQIRYSFIRDEFVHPLIVRELIGWLSDRYETIAAIDLVSANHSNRFSGDVCVHSDGSRTRVEWYNGPREFFCYTYIATSPSGIHMLECQYRSGGSGIFGWICLLALDQDRSVYEGAGASKEALFTRERVLLKTLGSITLGDRYVGKITYQDSILIIGPDEGWFRRGDAASKQIPIR